MCASPFIMHAVVLYLRENFLRGFDRTRQITRSNTRPIAGNLHPQTLRRYAHRHVLERSKSVKRNGDHTRAYSKDFFQLRTVAVCR